MSYSRSGGRQPPRDREILEIAEDGNFQMWRSVGWATQPPTPIGRFAGSLSSDLARDLARRARAAAEAGNLTLRPPPGSALERVRVDGVEARLGIHDEPGGAWGALLEQTRRLLGDLTRHPRAAMAIEARPEEDEAKLVHAGTETLRLDLSELSVRVVLWQGYEKVGDWRSAGRGDSLEAPVEAAPGWSLSLPFGHRLELAPGREMVVYATFRAFDGERAVPVSLATPRVPVAAG